MAKLRLKFRNSRFRAKRSTAERFPGRFEFVEDKAAFKSRRFTACTGRAATPEELRASIEKRRASELK